MNRPVVTPPEKRIVDLSRHIKAFQGGCSGWFEMNDQGQERLAFDDTKTTLIQGKQVLDNGAWLAVTTANSIYIVPAYIHTVRRHFEA
jgi:hypothetical protein